MNSTASIAFWYSRLTLSDVIEKIPVLVKHKTFVYCTKHSLDQDFVVLAPG